MTTTMEMNNTISHWITVFLAGAAAGTIEGTVCNCQLASYLGANCQLRMP